MNQSNTDAIHFFYSLSLKKKKAHTRGEGDKCTSASTGKKKKENLGTGLARILPLARLSPLWTPDPIDTFHVWPGGASNTE